MFSFRYLRRENENIKIIFFSEMVFLKIKEKTWLGWMLFVVLCYLIKKKTVDSTRNRTSTDMAANEQNTYFSWNETLFSFQTQGFKIFKIMVKI